MRKVMPRPINYEKIDGTRFQTAFGVHYEIEVSNNECTRLVPVTTGYHSAMIIYLPWDPQGETGYAKYHIIPKGQSPYLHTTYLITKRPLPKEAIATSDEFIRYLSTLAARHDELMKANP
jgi:hypothetical protein